MHVSLLTYAPGDTLETMWGHVALRVRDDRTGVDLVFDWGLIDGRGSLPLAARFLAGKPTSHLSIQAYADMAREYGARSRRFREDRLWLDRRQRARLVRDLVWNAWPEHRVYEYDLLGRNCATQVRDLLDAALAGRIADRLRAIPSGGTWRDHIAATLRRWPLVDLGLDIVLSAEVDRPISAWDELALPGALREGLRTVLASAEAGAPTGSLLGEADYGLPPAGHPPGGRLPVSLVASGVGALAVIGLARTTRAAPQRSRMRILGAGILALGVVSALLGTLMAWAWIATPHTVLHHNASLWLFWPVDWVVAAFGLSLLIKGESWPRGSRRAWWLRRLLQAHLVAAGVFVVLWVGGFLEQVVTPVIVGVVPVAALTFGAAWLAVAGVPAARPGLSPDPAGAMPAGA